MTGEARRLIIEPRTGVVTVAGFFGSVVNQFAVSDGVARWNGYAWLTFDLNVAATGTILAGAVSTDGTAFFGGNFTGTARAAAVTQVVNAGMGDAYPTIKVRNIGAGTVRPIQIANTGMGDYVFFNALSLLPGEELTLVTEPGFRSLTSDYRGNLFGAFVGGSNLASLRLQSGTNYISLYCDSGSVSAAIYWRSRSDSVDGGTIF